MIGKAVIVFLALAGTAQAKCLVERAGMPPAVVTNVQDADCDMFNYDFNAARPVTRYFIDRSAQKDVMQPEPTPTKTGDQK